MQSNLKKLKFGLPIIIILFIIAFLFLMRACLSMFDENYLTGKVQIYNANGRDIIAGIKKYEQCTSYKSSGGFTNRGVKIHYYLQIRDAQTGSLIKQAKIKIRKNTNVRLLGGRNNIWLFADNAFIIYNPADLAVIADNDKICMINTFLNGKMPDDLKYLSFNELDKTVEITAKDGIVYFIDCDTLKASEKKDPKSDNKKEIEKLRKELYALKDYSKSNSYYDAIAKIEKINKSFDERDDRIKQINKYLEEGLEGGIIIQFAFDDSAVYSALSDEDSLNQHFSMHFTGVSGNHRRKIYRGTFDKKSFDQYGSMKIEDSWENTAGKEVFLNGGFIINPLTLTAVRLHNPESFIVLHRKTIDDKSGLILTRIGLDGSKSWEKELTLKTIAQLLMTESGILLFSNDGKKINGRDKYSIITTVDANTGELKTFELY